MEINELQQRKLELELRLSIAIAEEIDRFVHDTGVRVNDIRIPMQEVYELGSMSQHNFISVEIGLEL